MGLKIDDQKLYNDILPTISTLLAQYIIADDFNCVLDPFKNKTGPDNSFKEQKGSLNNISYTTPLQNDLKEQ